MTPLARTLRDVSCSNELITVNMLDSPGIQLQGTFRMENPNSTKALVD